jgi:hypothetical protein
MKHLFLSLLLAASSFVADAAIKGPISITASVIDISKSSEEVRKISSYAVCASHWKFEGFPIFGLELDKKFPTAVQIRLSAPVDPCGTEDYIEFSFGKDSTTSTFDRSAVFHIPARKDRPQWFKVTVTTDFPMLPTAHEEVFKSMMMASEESAGHDGEMQDLLVKIGTLTMFGPEISSLSFVDFLMYPSYQFSRGENDKRHVQFSYEADQINRGTVEIRDLTWDPEGMHPVAVKTMKWHVGPNLELILTDEKGEEQILELHWCPDENDGTFNPIDWDDTFPNMWFKMDDMIFISESMASC